MILVISLFCKGRNGNQSLQEFHNTTEKDYLCVVVFVKSFYRRLKTMTTSL